MVNQLNSVDLTYPWFMYNEGPKEGNGKVVKIQSESSSSDPQN